MITRPSDAVLETERLWLCRVNPERDFERFAETLADAENVRYIGGKVMSPPQAWRAMAMLMGHWEIRGYGFFSCIEKSSGEHIGRVGPWNPQGWPEPEVGWTLHPEFHGKGYASEAGRASIDYVFRELGWPKVIHVIEHGNTNSVAVAERLGSRHLYDVDGLPGVTDAACWIYGQDRPA